MKLSLAFVAAVMAQSASAHYIFTTLIAGTTKSTTAVRLPPINTGVADVTSNDMRCNANSAPATSTQNVNAGDTIGFIVGGGDPPTLYHQGPAAIYLGTPPAGQTAASWDGSGTNWFKIAEWGGENFGTSSFGFTDNNFTQLTTTIPKATPSGQYLVRAEQIGMHITNAPQWYISCAQINIQNGGTGSPSPKVAIPGYESMSDPNLTLNIYYPYPTAYTVPGPRVWSGAAGGSTTTSSVSSITPTPTTVTHTSTTTTTSSAAGATLTQYAQCGGQGWTGTGTCAPPAKCSAVSPPYYSQCL